MDREVVSVLVESVSGLLLRPDPVDWIEFEPKAEESVLARRLSL
jgi:hypothetical protein